MRIFFIRHGETHWNKLKKYQGHTDIPLSDNGVRQVSSWRIPENIEHWFVSPLSRAVQTADLHQLQPRTSVVELIEANWGDWEGKTLKEIRQDNPALVERLDGQGLDLFPPGGESPRQVKLRLQSWLGSIPDNYRRIGAVTHRGVIRAALSLATDWDMKSDHAINITHNRAYEFNWSHQNLEYTREHELMLENVSQ